MKSQPQNPDFRINPENFHIYVRIGRYLRFLCICKITKILCAGSDQLPFSWEMSLMTKKTLISYVHEDPQRDLALP